MVLPSGEHATYSTGSFVSCFRFPPSLSARIKPCCDIKAKYPADPHAEGPATSPEPTFRSCDSPVRDAFASPTCPVDAYPKITSPLGVQVVPKKPAARPVSPEMSRGEAVLSLLTSPGITQR